jgi:hypothetical protein
MCRIDVYSQPRDKAENTQSLSISALLGEFRFGGALLPTVFRSRLQVLMEPAVLEIFLLNTRSYRCFVHITIKERLV